MDEVRNALQNLQDTLKELNLKSEHAAGMLACGHYEAAARDVLEGELALGMAGARESAGAMLAALLASETPDIGHSVWSMRPGRGL